MRLQQIDHDLLQLGVVAAYLRQMPVDVESHAYATGERVPEIFQAHTSTDRKAIHNLFLLPRWQVNGLTRHGFSLNLA
jgi:hypothetical protein